MKAIQSSGNNEWETPPEIFQHWDDRFMFDCDVAASKENRKGLFRYITKEENALAPETEWEQRNWMNPPFGRGLILPFVKRASILATMQDKLTVALLPVATSTKWWQEYVVKADYLYFYPYRINFLRDGKVVKGVAFDPCIVIWGLQPKPIKGLVYNGDS